MERKRGIEVIFHKSTDLLISSVMIILIIITIIIVLITNPIAYGTRMFNAAFTRALQ